MILSLKRLLKIQQVQNHNKENHLIIKLKVNLDQEDMDL